MIFYYVERHIFGLIRCGLCNGCERVFLIVYFTMLYNGGTDGERWEQLIDVLRYLLCSIGRLRANGREGKSQSLMAMECFI